MRAVVPESGAAYTRRIFATVAPVYPFVTRALSLFRDTAWKRTLVSALPAQEYGVALDIASGTGDIARAVKQRFPSAASVAVDNSMLMLAKIPASARSSIPRSLQDICALAVRSRSVDLITGGYALRNAYDFPAALAEIARVTKPGGVAAFLDFSKPRSPLLAAVYNLLLFFWGSLWGLLLHGNPRIYAYIAESLGRFPDRAALRRHFASYGFAETASWRRMFGIIEIVIFRKSGNA